MSTPFIAAVMIHVLSVGEAMDWYERVFLDASRSHATDEEFEFLLVGQVRLEFVLADHKASPGPGGSVVYWQFPLFEEALQRFQGSGAKMYRGPFSIEDGQLMCEVQDPWGNCIGLRGRSAQSKRGLVEKQPPGTRVKWTRSVIRGV